MCIHVRVVRDHLKLFVQALTADNQAPSQTLPLLAILHILCIASVITLTCMPSSRELLSDSEDLESKLTSWKQNESPRAECDGMSSS